jgi:hypothetical protein
MNLFPPLAFIIFLIIAFILGWSGKRMAPRGPADKDAETSYAGGEDIPGEKKFPGYETFFTLALFFTILHVLALLIGLMPKGSTVIGLIYAGIVGFALLAVSLR